MDFPERRGAVMLVTSFGVWLTLFIETIMKAAVYITKICNVLFLGNILLTTYLTSQSSVRRFLKVEKLQTPLTFPENWVHGTKTINRY